MALLDPVVRFLYVIFVRLPVWVVQSYVVQAIVRIAVRCLLLFWVVLAILLAAQHTIDETKRNMVITDIPSEILSVSDLAMDIVYISIQLAFALSIDDFIGNVFRIVNHHMYICRGKGGTVVAEKREKGGEKKKGGEDEEEDTTTTTSTTTVAAYPSIPMFSFGIYWWKFLPIPHVYVDIFHIFNLFFQLNDIKTHETAIVAILSASVSLLFGYFMCQNSDAISKVIVAAINSTLEHNDL